MEEFTGVVCTMRDRSVSMMPYSIPLEVAASDVGGLNR